MENLVGVQICELFKFEEVLEYKHQKCAQYCQDSRSVPLRLWFYLPGKNLIVSSCAVHFIKIQ